METKTSRAISYLQKGELQKALSIFSTFRIGFTKDEQRSMQIAFEALNGHKAFYESLGIDTTHEIAKSRQILQKKYTNVHNFA